MSGTCEKNILEKFNYTVLFKLRNDIYPYHISKVQTKLSSFLFSSPSVDEILNRKLQILVTKSSHVKLFVHFSR